MRTSGGDGMDEEELLRRFRACEDEAGAELVGRHQDRLLGRALRLLLGRAGARQAAEDLVQETFLRDKTRAKRSGVPVDAWLLTILVNLVRSYLRNPRRHHDPAGESLPGTSEDCPRSQRNGISSYDGP